MAIRKVGAPNVPGAVTAVIGPPRKKRSHRASSRQGHPPAPQLSGTGGGSGVQADPRLASHQAMPDGTICLPRSSQSKSRSFFQTACMMTASLRATATVARRRPIRATNARPQRRSELSVTLRVRMAFAAWNR